MAIEPVVADRQLLVTAEIVVAGVDGRPATLTVRVRAGLDDGIRVGERVRLTFDAEATHAFDANGDRLDAVLYST